MRATRRSLTGEWPVSIGGRSPSRMPDTASVEGHRPTATPPVAGGRGHRSGEDAYEGELV